MKNKNKRLDGEKRIDKNHHPGHPIERDRNLFKDQVFQGSSQQN